MNIYSETKQAKAAFIKYCQYEGSLKSFAESYSKNPKTCFNWASKYEWEKRKADLVGQQTAIDRQIQEIRQAQANLLRDSDDLRETVRDLMKNLNVITILRIKWRQMTGSLIPPLYGEQLLIQKK